MCTTTYLESVFTEDFVKLTNTIYFSYDFTENFVKMSDKTLTLKALVLKLISRKNIEIESVTLGYKFQSYY